jgi:allantoicase
MSSPVQEQSPGRPDADAVGIDPVGRAAAPPPVQDFTHLPDLASRSLGGSVVYANDELFAERENLIKPEAPSYSTYTFGHKGQVYDGWETRRRREPGFDHAIVRLGAPGIVRGVVVDTAFFKGNYPPAVSVEGAAVEGYPSPGELQDAAWVPLRRPLVTRRTPSPSTSRSASPTSACACTPTAGWRGCGCTARWCRTRGSWVPEPWTSPPSSTGAW